MPDASGYGRSQIIQAIMSTLTMNFPVLTSILCKLYKFNSLATMLKKPLKKKAHGSMATPIQPLQASTQEMHNYNGLIFIGFLKQT